MHPSLARLYESAKSLKKPIVGKSAVAAWLNESPQSVNNWETRGVSRRGALAAQDKTGYSATWILKGTGEKLIGAAALPALPEKGAVSKPLSSEEKELISHWRNLLRKDRQAKLTEIAKLADERLAEKEELLAEVGSTGQGVVKDLPREQGSSKQQRRANGRP